MSTAYTYCARYANRSHALFTLHMTKRKKLKASDCDPESLVGARADTRSARPIATRTHARHHIKCHAHTRTYAIMLNATRAHTHANI